MCGWQELDENFDFIKRYEGCFSRDWINQVATKVFTTSQSFQQRLEKDHTYKKKIPKFFLTIVKYVIITMAIKRYTSHL